MCALISGETCEKIKYMLVYGSIHKEIALKVIDMHAHILPQIDDGSKSVKMSLAMLAEMKKQGVSVVCATSHYYRDQNDIDTFLARRNHAYQKLEDARKEDALPMILPASETAYFSNIATCDKIERLCIYGTNTLMLEMPFTEWTELMVEEVESLVLDRRIRVVLVHPERFCFSEDNKKKLKKFAEMSIPFQVNAQTLIDWKTRKLGLSLLEMSDYPLLGSDSHNLDKRKPNLLYGREVVRKKLGQQFLNRIEKNCYRYILEENYGKKK